MSLMMLSVMELVLRDFVMKIHLRYYCYQCVKLQRLNLTSLRQWIIPRCVWYLYLGVYLVPTRLLILTILFVFVN